MPLVNKPTVAVWMVTYNHETYIAEAISSVMGQVTDFEVQLFIGEDCSTDGTRAICKTFADQYPDRITLLENSHNLGSRANAFQVYEACLASGAPYIALLEGDDYWTDPHKLQQQVEFLESHSDYSFSFTRFMTLDPSGRLEDKNAHFFTDTSPLDYDFDFFTRGWYGGTLTVLFRSAYFDLERFKHYRYFRDIHLYTELLIHGVGVCLNLNTAVYRIHDQGQHNTLTKLSQFRIGVACYQELYAEHHLSWLYVKYRYFINAYVSELLIQKQYLRAFITIFRFAQDFIFIKKYMKKLIKSIFKPILKPSQTTKSFPGSASYWETRYLKNKTSGAGSYGRLAQFKADILNAFVRERHIRDVIEYGCGDGNQLQLATYPHYIGFDVSETALKLCREQFADDTSKSFYSSFDPQYFDIQADLCLSLDVIYHLIEDAVFEAYMSRLFDSAQRYVIIYSSNYDEQKVAHVKCRKFTDWIDAHIADVWTLEQVIPNRYPFDAADPNQTSMADFYIYKKL